MKFKVYKIEGLDGGFIKEEEFIEEIERNTKKHEIINIKDSDIAKFGNVDASWNSCITVNDYSRGMQ